MIGSASRTDLSNPGFDTYLIGDRSRFRLLQMAHGDSVLFINQETAVRYASASAARHLDVPTQALIGQPILALLHRQDMLVSHMMLERVTSGKAPAMEWVTRLRSGSRWEWFKVRATRFAYAREEEPVTAIFLRPLASEGRSRG